MIPVLGHVISPGIEETTINCPCRVLAISMPSDAVWLIPLPREKGSATRCKSHVLGPERHCLSGVSEALAQGRLSMADVPLPGLWQMTDADYLDSAANASDRKLREGRIKKRDKRWSVLKEIIGDQHAREIVPVPSLLVQKIAEVALRHGISKPTIYSWLHRFWAGRECLNSLLPNTNRCGGPGQRKKQTSRRPGRKSRRFKEGRVQSEGYALTDVDPERLARGYALKKPGVTMEDAYLWTMGAYWSTPRQDESGIVHYDLFPDHMRPTRPQFEYWGRELHGSPLRRKITGLDRWVTSTLTLTGSTQDQVHAVGQMAMIDATSTDVYLTSMMSRHTILPPMSRTIVIDVRSTVAMGFHVGWEDLSSGTSLLAILCAASDKKNIVGRYGIDLELDQWPGMLHRLYLADNGEMKSEAVKEAERQFRFGVEYAKAYSGQSKSLVETHHHTAHKSLDHKLPGTTRGKKRERGEPEPKREALWNYAEYMHEFILDLIDYNDEEVPDLAPLDMTRAGVAPTRLNIFRWLRDHGVRADIACDLDQLRAFTLPSHKAVFRRDGVHLLMDDERSRIRGHRFFAEEILADARWQKAARGNGSVSLLVKLDVLDLSHIWLPTEGGMVFLPNVQAEQALLEGLTLGDWKVFLNEQALRTDGGQQARDQRALEKLGRRGKVSRTAAAEKKAELTNGKVVPTPVNKQSLRQNTMNEKERLRPTVTLGPKDATSAPDLSSSGRVPDAADAAMETFLRETAR